VKRIGVDTGGTFTDAVVWDEEEGLLANAKESSNKQDPPQAVMGAIAKLGANASAEVRYLIHGTTVATNATLERIGPRVGMLCTKGFRDVLEIARLTRPPEQIYDLKANPPPPFIARRDRLEIGERIDHRGQVIEPVDEGSVVEAARIFLRRKIKAIAVCLLHSYINGEHERRVREILLREIPDAAISLSHEVLPEFREYERSSTTALNAFLAPIVATYLNRLQTAVGRWSQDTKLWVMQSNGGVASAQRTAELPVTILLSGPSGGVVAGRYLMEQIGLENGITVDMGGTSYDVCLLPGSNVPMTHERHVMDMPVKVPSVDILTIGAGGGSIGWVDGAGQFRVGPRSAGANPGPACYGRGGTEPTVTDANLVLGILGPEQRLGGEVKLDLGAAMRACELLGRKLGLNAVETAWGIRRIVNAAMAGATRAVSVGRGYDPRDFSLIAFGGAGPMHAVDIATELEIPRIIVPRIPGCFSAMGLVVSDVVHDYMVTHIAPAHPNIEAPIDRHFARLTEDAHAELTEDDIDEGRRDLFRGLDMRYVGEQSSISVPVNAHGAGWLRVATALFHEMHERLYGFSVADEPIEVVNVRLKAVGRLHRTKPTVLSDIKTSTSPPQRDGARPVAFGPAKSDRQDVPVYLRETLVPGTQFVGPAVVEQNDTTLIVPPRMTIRSDAYSNLLVQGN